MKKSIIYSFTAEEIKEIMKGSNTIRESLIKIGLKDVGGNRKTFFNYININNLLEEFELLKKRSEKARIDMSATTRRICDNEVFCENSSFSRVHLKERIIKNNLIEYKCEECGNIGKWNNKKLILQLEHKNGKNNDNRLENLSFLCPNCHSQTETFAGKSAELTRKKNRFIVERNNFLQSRRNYLDNIDTSKFGWIAEVQKEWKVSHTQVKRWIKRNYPNFKYFERNKLK